MRFRRVSEALAVVARFLREPFDRLPSHRAPTLGLRGARVRLFLGPSSRHQPPAAR
jgi:hypothetical protein